MIGIPDAILGFARSVDEWKQEFQYATQTDSECYFDAEELTSFWKRGFFRSGSNIGSSRSNAGVSGGFAAKGASYGIESSFSSMEMERSLWPMRAATLARMSSGLGPVSASLSVGNIAIARSAKVSAAALSPRPMFVSAR